MGSGIYSSRLMPDCAECNRLMAECERRDREYKEALAALKSLEASPAPVFMSSRLMADEAKLDAELARRKLDRHRKQHHSE